MELIEWTVTVGKRKETVGRKNPADWKELDQFQRRIQRRSSGSHSRSGWTESVAGWTEKHGLMQELVDTQRVYHDTLRQTLADHQLKLQWLHPSAVDNRRQNAEAPTAEAAEPLVFWLETNGLGEISIKKTNN